MYCCVSGKLHFRCPFQNAGSPMSIVGLKQMSDRNFVTLRWKSCSVSSIVYCSVGLVCKPGLMVPGCTGSWISNRPV